jgi:hypothetical protein
LDGWEFAGTGIGGENDADGALLDRRRALVGELGMRGYGFGREWGSARGAACGIHGGIVIGDDSAVLIWLCASLELIVVGKGDESLVNFFKHHIVAFSDKTTGFDSAAAKSFGRWGLTLRAPS